VTDGRRGTRPAAQAGQLTVEHRGSHPPQGHLAEGHTRRRGTSRTNRARDGQASEIRPELTEICLLGSGLVAGPSTTLPSLALNLLPWHGQSIVPSAT
jgi:hypothetical protein